jgi:acetate kinase
MADAILALNAGSSSIKFALYRLAPEHGLQLAARGAVEGIGTKPRFAVRDAVGAEPPVDPDEQIAEHGFMIGG